MNPIICPVRNNLHLTRKAVATFQAQDIEGGVEILVVNNASSDGTNEWLQTQKEVGHVYYAPPVSVAESWNRMLQVVFKWGAEYALVVNNDVELRPDTYRLLVDDGGGFVTAVGTRDAEKIKSLPHDQLNQVTDEFLRREGAWGLPLSYPLPDPAAKRPHPDFSCFLIRREVYERVGPFDEGFKIAFCEDCDYDLRLYKSGIRAYCLDLPFLHHGSATIKNADPAEVRKIQVQAQRNREYFKSKWGFEVGSPEYYQCLGKGEPENTDASVGASVNVL